jgi:N4-(beta-N-acetylglucosaminyl)-L-asparaginase
LYFKIPGRVGDSPIIGAGLYLNNDVGSAGSTGRGEANILNCSSFLAVEEMRRNPDKSLKDCLIESCKRIVATNRDKRLQDAKGRPNFNVRFFAVRKNGEFAGASLYAGVKMAVHDGESARLVDCISLYDDVLDESL